MKSQLILTKENQRRARRAQKALGQYIEEPEPFSHGLTDLLADLRHYCDANRLDFASCDKTAYGHYTGEKFQDAFRQGQQAALVAAANETQELNTHLEHGRALSSTQGSRELVTELSKHATNRSAT